MASLSLSGRPNAPIRMRLAQRMADKQLETGFVQKCGQDHSLFVEGSTRCFGRSTRCKKATCEFPESGIVYFTKLSAGSEPVYLRICDVPLTFGEYSSLWARTTLELAIPLSNVCNVKRAH
jgi:hypothetical protein